MRGKYLSVCMQNVNIYQGQPVPTPSTANVYWNYMVPIWNNCSALIDLVLVQAYNNWYDSLTEGTLSYLQDTYLNWINVPSPFCTGCTKIANFSGIPQNKLVMGVPASQAAGQTAPSGATIDSFQQWLAANNYSMAGAFIWDSYWDSQNQYTISNAILTASTQTPLTPLPPSSSSICPQQSTANTSKKNTHAIFEKSKN
jgi:chitinase